LIGHHEVKGMGVAFGGFLCGNAFVSITLVSPPVSIFSSWVQLSNSTSARGRSKELLQLFVSKEACADVGACPEGKSLVWSLCCCDIFFFFERVLQRLPSAASNRGWYGCTLPWVKCNILYKNQTAMFSYCITLCLYSAYARHKFCMADYLAYCNKYFVSAMFSYHDIVNLRGSMFESLCYDCRETAVMCW
jgi:hypothetical protein